MFWDVLRCSGMFWDVLWDVLGCSGLFLDVQGLYSVLISHKYTSKGSSAYFAL